MAAPSLTSTPRAQQPEPLKKKQLEALSARLGGAVTDALVEQPTVDFLVADARDRNKLELDRHQQGFQRASVHLVLVGILMTGLLRTVGDTTLVMFSARMARSLLGVCTFAAAILLALALALYRHAAARSPASWLQRLELEQIGGRKVKVRHEAFLREYLAHLSATIEYNIEQNDARARILWLAGFLVYVGMFCLTFVLGMALWA